MTLPARLRLDDLPARPQGDGWYLILDPTPITKYGCVIEPAGCELADFMGHGAPGLWNHDRDRLPVSTWEIKIEGNRMLGRPTFDSPEMNPLAPAIGKYFAAGRLRLSAALDVIESGVTTINDDKLEHVTKSMLKEVTFCLYGAHPTAGLPVAAGPAMSLMLAEDVKAGTITEADAAALAKELEKPPASLASGPAPDGKSSVSATVNVDAASLEALTALLNQFRDTINTEIAAVRKELEPVRSDRDRLAANAQATPEPAASPEPAGQADNPPGTNTAALTAALLADPDVQGLVEQLRAKRLSLTVQRLVDERMRKVTGRLPD